MADVRTIDVEVAYARPDEQVIIPLTVDSKATVEEVIRESGILERYPEIDLGSNKVGVFGKLGRLDDTLHAGDRVEIYRRLIADPKQVRRERAARSKAEGERGGGRKGGPEYQGPDSGGVDSTSD